MRISDWSSDVCSSDLPNLKPFLRSGEHGIELRPAGERYRSDLALIRRIYDRVAVGVLPVTADTELQIGIGHHDLSPLDRKSVVEGKSVSVRVDLGGCRIIKKKKQKLQSIKHET